MDTKARHLTIGALGATLAAAGIVAVTCVTQAPEAQAREKHAVRVAHHDHRHSRFHRRHVAIPRVVRSRDRAFYAEFYTGRVYHRAHRHHHARYNFPVFVDGVVVVRPYDYCGGRVYVTGGAVLPRLAIGVSVGSFGGYYEDYGYPPHPGYVACDRDHYDHDDEYDEYDDD